VRAVERLPQVADRLEAVAGQEQRPGPQAVDAVERLVERLLRVFGRIRGVGRRVPEGERPVEVPKPQAQVRGRCRWARARSLDQLLDAAAASVPPRSLTASGSARSPTSSGSAASTAPSRAASATRIESG
jgi:hypothetical protein